MHEREQNIFALTPDELFERLGHKEWRLNNLYQIVLENGTAVPFQANMIQSRIRKEMKGKKNIILKYRQWGVSTEFIVSRVDDIVFGGMNITSYFVTHRQDLLDEFFRKAKYTLETIHEIVRPFVPIPQAKNANEIFFKETNNMLRIGLDVRGKTPTHLHISELAHMTHEVQWKLFVAMESFRECNITIESTANGQGDIFHGLVTQAKQGDSEYNLLFYGFDVDDRNEIDAEGFVPTSEEETFITSFLSKYQREKALRKIAWRRMKIHTYKAKGLKGEDYFCQENPISIEDAFISSGSAVFDLNQPYQIQQPIRSIEGFNLFCDPCDELTIGIDIAEGGIRGDYSTISARRPDGKLAFQFKDRVNEIILAQKLDWILNYQAEPNGKKYLGVIAPENNVGLAFINECFSTRDNGSYKYPWCQYILKQRKIDDVSEENIQEKYGFRTTKQSKDLIIREYRGAIYSKKIWVSPELYAEICTYQYDDKNRPNAVGNNHDDLLIADMIAFNIMEHEHFVAKYHVTEKDLLDMDIVSRHMARLKMNARNWGNDD